MNEEEMINLYKRGYSLREIASMAGMTAPGVLKIIKKHGYGRRSIKEGNKLRMIKNFLMRLEKGYLTEEDKSIIRVVKRFDTYSAREILKAYFNLDGDYYELLSDVIKKVDEVVL